MINVAGARAAAPMSAAVTAVDTGASGDSGDAQVMEGMNHPIAPNAPLVPGPLPQVPSEHRGLGVLGIAGAAVGGAGLLTATFGSFAARSFFGRPALSTALLAGGAVATAAGLAMVAAAKSQADAWAAAHIPAPAPRPVTPPPTTLTGVSGAIPNVAAPANPPSVELETVATGLGTLTQVTSAPGDTDGLWLVDKTGKLQRRAADGTVSTKLDISKLVSSSGEQGLLSVAFHPDFAKNGKLYVDYTDLDGDTHVATAHAGENGVVDPDSLVDLMKIDQPYANHNGGQLQFGPDGMLYIGMGDGGSGDDPQNRAQDLTQHLGKILRIDVDHPSGGKPYGIPSDNPFVSTLGAQPEIYASGVRNPWRFSFDSKTGDLYIGDVGQNKYEEVDYAKKGDARGVNFGWDTYEGAHAHEGTQLATGRVVNPVLEYTHAEGSSITGGYVYRGSKIPALEGYYVYSDIANDKLRALKVTDGKIVDRREMPGGRPMTVSYGEGPDGELYGVTIGGELTKVVAAQATGPVTPPPVDTTGATKVPIAVNGEQMRFDKSEYHVKAGKVTLELKNTSRQATHNIGIHLPNSDELTMSDMAMAGETKSVTVDLEPGEYVLYCLPHEGMGMTAKLIVE